MRNIVSVFWDGLVLSSELRVSMTNYLTLWKHIEFDHRGWIHVFASEYFVVAPQRERLTLSSRGCKHACRLCINKSPSIILAMWEDTVAFRCLGSHFYPSVTLLVRLSTVRTHLSKFCIFREPLSWVNSNLPRRPEQWLGPHRLVTRNRTPPSPPSFPQPKTSETFF